MRETILTLLLSVVAAQLSNADEHIPFDVAPWPIDSLCRMPEYPEIASRGGIPGKVQIQLYIDTTGQVLDYRIASSKPHELGFEAAVVTACTTWVFTPAEYHGQSAEVWIDIPFIFRVTSASFDSSSIVKQLEADGARSFADSIAAIHMKDPTLNFIPEPITKVNPRTHLIIGTPEIVR